MDEARRDALQGRVLAMKIKTERLNQIINEEVLRFKKLNEQLAPQVGTQMTPAQKLAIIKKKVAALTEDKTAAIDEILAVVGMGE